jgi:hypothetical protein
MMESTTMTAETEHPRVSALERRAVHTDEVLTKVLQNQASQQSTMESVVLAVDKLATRINQPNNTNWWGMISSLVALVILLGAIGIMKTEPMNEEIDDNGIAIAALVAVQAARGFKMGEMAAFTEQTDATLLAAALRDSKQWDIINKLRVDVAVNTALAGEAKYQLRHLDMQVHTHSDRISTTEKLAAAAATGLKTQGKYTDILTSTLTQHIINDENHHP